MPVSGGTSTLEFLLQRLTIGLDADIKLVLLTSNQNEDDALAELASTMGVTVFRGDLGNVLLRFQSAITELGCDYVCRVTADNPFTDPKVINHFFHMPPTEGEYKSTKLGQGWPIGIDVEFFTGSDLVGLDGTLISPEEREHVTLSFYSNGPFRLPKLTGLDSDVTDPHILDCSLTIDRLEDLLRMRKVSEILGESALTCNWIEAASVAASVFDEA